MREVPFFCRFSLGDHESCDSLRGQVIQRVDNLRIFPRRLRRALS